MLSVLAAAGAAWLNCAIAFSGGTNGVWQEKFTHEIAHGNGWPANHAGGTFLPGKAALPPKKYVYPYEGKLTLLCGGTYKNPKPCSLRVTLKICTQMLGRPDLACSYCWNEEGDSYDNWKEEEERKEKERLTQ